MSKSHFSDNKFGDKERKKELEAALSIVRRIDCLPTQ